MAVWLCVAVCMRARAFAALIPPQFYCAGEGCSSILVPSPAGFVPATTSDYVHNFFGASYDDRWYFTLSTFLFAIVYRMLAMLATRYISHLKR